MIFPRLTGLQRAPFPLPSFRAPSPVSMLLQTPKQEGRSHKLSPGGPRKRCCGPRRGTGWGVWTGGREKGFKKEPFGARGTVH